MHAPPRVMMAGISAAALLAGCATSPPDYQPPSLATPDAFRGQGAEAGAASIADLPWASVFTDPALKGLIEEGLRNNYDVQVAVARIEQARASVGVIESQGKPQVGFETYIGGEQVNLPNRDRISSGALGRVGANLNVAWEFDVWGRIRHSTEAARANLLGQEDIRHGVMLTLVADLASGYYRLLALDRELAIAQESRSAYTRTLDLFTLRFNAGQDSRLPVERVQGNVEASNAEIGVAVADKFPRLGLSALVGAEGVAFSGSSQGLGVWSAALSLAGPLFDGGRRREVYNNRKAFWDETVAQYKQSTVIAFQETSDALIAQQNLTVRLAAQQREVEAAQRSVDLALTRYNTGRASYFEVLEAQQQLFPAQDRLAQTQRDQLLAVVDLYKALGGGWTPDPPPTQTAQLH